MVAVSLKKYKVSKGEVTPARGALVDGGANGFMLGDDCATLETVAHASCDVTGIADQTVTNLDIAQGASYVETLDDGPVIAVMSQAANLGRGKTILSKGQMEAFGVIVDDTSHLAGGKQCIITNEGYILPLHIRDGLPRLDMRKPTRHELATLPYVYLTSDASWEPVFWTVSLSSKTPSWSFLRWWNAGITVMQGLTTLGTSRSMRNSLLL